MIVVSVFEMSFKKLQTFLCSCWEIYELHIYFSLNFHRNVVCSMILSAIVNKMTGFQEKTFQYQVTILC
jgi:hypothetical protein